MERCGPEWAYRLTFEDVVEILKLVDAGRFDELRLETDGLDIEVVFRRESGDAGDRASAGAAPTDPPIVRAASAPSGEVPGSPSPAVAPAAAPATASAPGPAPATAVPAGAVAVTAPLAGVFYRAPAPGAPPFVEVGRTVGEGERVGLIEVMKLFTPVLATCSGVVSEIRAENEQSVHSGQVLVVIAPAER